MNLQLLAQFISSLPVFAGMAASDAEKLAAAATTRSVDKGAHIFQRGEKANAFYIILNGWVKLYRDTREGDEAILGLFTRADTFGDAVVLNGEAFPYSAQAVETTSLVVIPATSLKEYAKSNPDLIVRIMQSLVQQMTRLQLENEHLSLMSASQRVGCLLLQLSDGQQTGACQIEFPYEKSLAATRLGMKAETFSRALAQLKNIGITVQGDNITIADMAALVDFVCADCSASDTDCKFSALHHCSAEDRARCGHCH